MQQIFPFGLLFLRLQRCCRYVAKYAVAPPVEAQVLQNAADVQADEDITQTPATDANAHKSHSQVSKFFA